MGRMRSIRLAAAAFHAPRRIAGTGSFRTGAMASANGPPPRPLRPLVECMASFGLKRRKIAAVAGCTEKTLRLQRESVNAATAEKVSELHWGLFRNHGPFRAHCSCEWTPEIRDFMESEMVA